MASTITIANTDTWAAPFVEQQPREINGMEPALGAANLVLQTVLGPPFTWPWNRGVITYQTSNQDFTVAGLTDFGFIEGGTVQTSTGQAWEIAVKHLLQAETQQARANYVSAFIDDGLGNITFRVNPAPDQAYSVYLPYQRKAPILQSMGMTWAPIPDEKNYICKWGYLSLVSLIGGDSRFVEYNQKFMSTLLSAQGGLSEMERNIFLANYVRVLSQLQGTQLGTAERYKAREV